MDPEILEHYNSAHGASRYTEKFRRRYSERINNWHEQRLLRRVLTQITSGTRVARALDLPCGYGRLHPVIREVARQVVEGDWSFPLLQVARDRVPEESFRLPAGFVRASALAMPFHDNVFDLVLSVRLSHHIREHAERLCHVRELMRVSSGWVVFTYFDADSFKNRLREVRRHFGDRRQKWTLDGWEIRDLADRCGFDLHRVVPLSRFFSGHRYAVLRRRNGVNAQP
jgi:SAM-dependent methyltransferase